MSQCKASSLYDHLAHCFIVFKDVHLRLALRRICVCGDVVHTRQLVNISISLLFGFGCVTPRTVSCCRIVVGVLALFDERNTFITTSHKSRAGNTSIRNPASNEVISDSVVLRDTDICFLHIQLMVTSVRLPKIHKTLPEGFSSSQGLQENLSRETKPVDNAKQCCPHDKIVGSHLCDECMKSILPIVCHMPESML